MSYKTALNQMIAKTEEKLNRKLKEEEIVILRDALKKSLRIFNRAV